MSQTTAKQAHTLLSYYELLFKRKYGRAPRLNRYTAKWAMVDVVDAVGYDSTKDLLDYFFNVDMSHEFMQFIYNYDGFTEAIEEQKADEESRRLIREKTKRRVEEWSREHRGAGNFGGMPE